MTIREKAEKVGIELEKVVELATAAGVDATDVDRELDKSEVGKLGMAVKTHASKEVVHGETEVLFWSPNATHIIGKGIVSKEAVEIKKHVIWLDAKDDAKTIANLRKLRLTDVFEVGNKPFDEESQDYFDFETLLNEQMFTGHTSEVSKTGIKSVRALFSDRELLELGKHAFDPHRLKARALRSKSVVRLINNGIN